MRARCRVALSRYEQLNITKQSLALLILFPLTVAFRANSLEQEEYLNYVAAIKNGSTLQYFVVVTVKDLNSGKTREICTKGSCLNGALHKEYHLDYDEKSIKKVERIWR